MRQVHGGTGENDRVVHRPRESLHSPMPQKRRKSPKQPRQPSLRWSPVNYALMGAGIVALAVGFFLLAQGSTVAAPLLLALAFVVLIPVGIIA